MHKQSRLPSCVFLTTDKTLIMLFQNVELIEKTNHVPLLIKQYMLKYIMPLIN